MSQHSGVFTLCALQDELVLDPLSLSRGVASVNSCSNATRPELARGTQTRDTSREKPKRGLKG